MKKAAPHGAAFSACPAMRLRRASSCFPSASQTDLRALPAAVPVGASPLRPLSKGTNPACHRFPFMADPNETHPLAPDIETAEERRENQTDAVNVRSAVEIGPMRWVLWIGLALAVLGMIVAYLFGYLPAL